MHFDFIIVGGGSAGCVLASRLSARSSDRVLLIEAGIDTPPGKVPADILETFPKAALNPLYKWTKLFASLQPRQVGHEVSSAPYDQGKVIGGGSSINFQAANRGAPDDYDEWVRLGAKGWGWPDVLPYFRKLEHDADVSNEYHGNDGPMPIQRMRRADWSGFSEAFALSAEERGLPFLADQNGAFVDGHFAAALSNLPDRRISVADAYLDPSTRARPNLQILTETLFEALEFDGSRVTGVRTNTRGEIKRFEGREIIISAGALHSPAILMRAGIGPAARLKALGIEVRADLNGVGENLREHPGVALLTYLPQASRVPPRTRPLQVSLRYSSGRDGCLPGDMYASSFSPATWHRLGARLGMVVLWVNKPHSAGRVTLRTSDFRDEPDVDVNLCSDPRDINRLLDGIHFIASLFEHGPLKSAAGEPFLAAFSKRARAAMTVNRTNAAAMALLGGMLDGPALLRMRLIRDVITQAPPLGVLLKDRTLLEANVRSNMLAIKHPSCTCRMGQPGDRLAVTDVEGRVFGVTGLRVCDGSIMPSLPRANTNIPIVMMAEKMADHILAE